MRRSPLDVEPYCISKLLTMFSERLELYAMYCLAGQVVKASASGAEDPGFESRLRRDFSGVDSDQ